MNYFIFLTNYVEKDSNFLILGIAKLFGYVIDFVFNIVYFLTVENSLGLAIILFTIIVRFLMIPLGYKQQKSMYIIQKIQPKISKIQQKYKGNKDPEAYKKMNIEMNKLYAEYNCSPFGGCFPLIIQLILFLGLYYIMKNPYLFIKDLGNIYAQIATAIQNTDGYLNIIEIYDNPFSALTPDRLSDYFQISNLDHLQKYLSKFNIAQWEQLQDLLPSLDISELLAQKTKIETFLGIYLPETAGFSFNSIKTLIPLLSGFTTFLSSWFMSKNSQSVDPNVKTQQKVMLVVMPIMMTVISVKIPCGLALYWIVGNIVQIAQQAIFKVHFKNKLGDIV